MIAFEQFIDRLKRSADTLAGLVQGVSGDQARWRPDADSWSLLEVVNHLYDEEREDFRVRLDILLHRPADEWPPIDPQGWVTARDYNTRVLEESLANFLDERAKSIAWLESLEKPDLASFVESRFGRMAAGDMLASWAAHDLLHIRQLMELHYLWMREQTEPFKPDYAGDF